MLPAWTRFSLIWQEKQQEQEINMKQFLVFIKKEWLHIWRDKRTLFILFGMPITQIILFGFALSNEVKNSKIAILNPSKDALSAQITEKINASRYFDLVKEIKTNSEIDLVLKSGEVNSVLVFPNNFEKDFNHNGFNKVQFIADASEPNTATTLKNYMSNILMDFQKTKNPNVVNPLQIKTEIRMLYNPQLKGAYNFVPGVMAMILLLVCTMMTSISIVKEKELGTMEVMLVSPLKPFMVIVAKAVPYFFLSMVNVVSILLLSVYALELPIKGSLVLLMAESMLFTITALSLGLLISTITGSQQVAMLISLVGMFLPTLMFSGFMFPIENMPLPLRTISNIVPAKWYFIIVKNVMLKGLGISGVLKETLILMGMTVFLLVLSVKKYKIRLA
jgi:ABC-2 type transport system permease protein